VGALVRPHNVETRVYARDRETMEGRVAEAERGEVVCVWKLLSCWSAYTVPHLQGAARKPALLTWCMISFRISIGRSSNFKGPWWLSPSPSILRPAQLIPSHSPCSALGRSSTHPRRELASRRYAHRPRRAKRRGRGPSRKVAARQFVECRVLRVGSRPWCVWDRHVVGGSI
jgi:hypothetical protein